MVEVIAFNTKRLRMRQWCAADREPFGALNADVRVMEFFPAPLNRTASDGLADRCQAFISKHGWGLWAVEIKETQEFIGFVGLNSVPPELPLSPSVEIGWRLAFQYWGKGFAVEAAKGALDVGFKSLSLPEVVSFTTAGNLRSRAVMKRLGMQEAEATFEHPNVPVDSGLRIHCLYRLSRAQWADNAA